MSLDYSPVSQKSFRDLAETDGMPAELRACVHDYGSAIVRALLRHGVTKPAHIREVVREIWDGARQPSQRLGHGSRTINMLDWILMQQGRDLSARTLLRVLYDHSFIVLPLEPTPQMIEASVATIRNFDQRVTKTEKHRRRLRAAHDAGIRHHWPELAASVGLATQEARS